MNLEPAGGQVAEGGLAFSRAGLEEPGLLAELPQAALGQLAVPGLERFPDLLALPLNERKVGAR